MHYLRVLESFIPAGERRLDGLGVYLAYARGKTQGTTRVFLSGMLN